MPTHPAVPGKVPSEPEAQPVTTTPPTLPTFEIFAPGSHTAMNGETLAFAAGDLTTTATAYDPALHEAPICVGHPKHDLPAYGWVKGLTVENGRLVAAPDQVDPAFAALVEAGRFKTRSAAFFRPAAKDNPVPGTWYLRHVAFLGAAPPAVTGLKPIAFAATDADTVVAFSSVEPGRMAWSLRNIGSLLRGFRDFLVEKEGAEKADTLIPSWRLDDLAADAARLEADPPPAFSAPVLEDDMTVKNPDPAELAKREADLAAREVAFAARLAEQQRADNVVFVDDLIRQGRLPSGQKDEVLGFMATLDATGTVAFAAAGATVQKTPLQAYRDTLAKMPTLVEFRELAAGDGKGKPDTAAFAAPVGYDVDPERLAIHTKAVAHQAEHPGTDYATAVRAVGGR